MRLATWKFFVDEVWATKAKSMFEITCQFNLLFVLPEKAFVTKPHARLASHRLVPVTCTIIPRNSRPHLLTTPTLQYPTTLLFVYRHLPSFHVPSPLPSPSPFPYLLSLRSRWLAKMGRSGLYQGAGRGDRREWWWDMLRPNYWSFQSLLLVFVWKKIVRPVSLVEYRC